MTEFPRGWCPIRIYPNADGFWVDWCDLAEERFTEPFFDMTIETCLRRPFNQLFRPQTPIAALGETAKAERSAPPAGFIFHMSRCGSTLVSQMLARLPQHIVISEASPIDAVLRANERLHQVSDEQRILWLRQLLACLGQQRFGERHLFVKFDCWHVMELRLVRRAFPDVPCIFLYREPTEVLVSQLRMRGAQMVPGILAPGVFKIDATLAGRVPADEYCARVLAAICAAAIENCRDGSCLAVNYRDLPHAFSSVILPHFRLASTRAEIDKMAEAAQYDAKSPMLPFAPDTPAKKREASDAVRATAETWLGPLYRGLEALGAASMSDAAVEQL